MGIDELCIPSDKDGTKSGDKHKQDTHTGLPRLSVCADAQKVDRAKLAQTEFTIIEFDADTFRILLDYLHTGSCPLTCRTIPGLICAAEHYDLPELLQACFHHAKQCLGPDVVCPMLITLENYYWRYTSAAELVNMIIAYTEFSPMQVLTRPDFLGLSESMVQMIMCRDLNCAEIRKFEAMHAWAKHRVIQKQAATPQAPFDHNDFKCTMERLTRDLKLKKISPQELIKIVLPTKAVRNERILETLMDQANTGVFRLQRHYLEQFRETMQQTTGAHSDSIDVGL